MALLDFPDPSASPYLGPNGVIYTYVGIAPNGYWSGSAANDGTSAFDDRFVNIIGDTMTGRLTLSDDPTDALHAVTKQYVDLLGDGATIHVGDTEPADKEQGSLWWNTTDNTLYIYYDEGVGGTSQWVVAVPQGEGGNDDYVSKVDTNSQNIVSDLTLGTDKITLDATDGSATFAGGNFSVNSLGGVNHYGRLLTKVGPDSDVSAYIVSHATTSSRMGTWYGDGSLVIGGNITGTGAANDNANITLNKDGSATFAGDVVSNSYITANGSRIGSTLFSINTRNEPTASVFQGQGVGNAVTSEIFNDGSATFAGQVNSGGPWPSNGTTAIGVDGYGYIGTGIASTCFSIYPSNGVNRTIGFQTDGNAQFQGVITANNVSFNLEADNPANYTTTTDADGNEASVYNGPTLDVKERLQNLISRLDAIEANEVVDDATDSALLQLVASLSARLDERDAEIAALTARVTTLES
jgi:hypothetical protein